MTSGGIFNALVGIRNGAVGGGRETPDSQPGEMTVRKEGRSVRLDAQALRRTFPAASGRLVIFLHGLGDTEQSWVRSRENFGSRLQSDYNFTPIYVRYNSGRRIAENGRDLERLLFQLIDHWPTRVVEVLLVGHSMGGLVARSALDVSNRRPRSTRRLPRRTALVCLGSPHGGVAVERAAARAAAILTRSTIGTPFARLLDLRSEGIKDLARGGMDGAWSTVGMPAEVASAATTERPRQPALFVVATLSRRENSVLARLFGDLLVGAASAGATTLLADRQWLGGLHHRDLLGHDRVYQTIRTWLDQSRAAST